MEQRDSTGGATVDRRRRRVLATVGASAIAGLAGCVGVLDGGQTDDPSTRDWIGSGPSGDRPLPGGTSMSEMPDLKGELTVYSGRGQSLVGELVEAINGMYDEFEAKPLYDSSSNLVNKILTEGENSPADVFYSVNAGSLGMLADEGRTKKLPSEVREPVREEFQGPDGHWVGTSGRARTIPYNTDAFEESDIPNDIFAFATDERFDGTMGWAPSYGSFQAFVTAMRLLNGEQKTKEWLRGMQSQNVQSFPDEFMIAKAVADGDVTAGFTNHYYIQRVLESRPDAPLATAFTKNDAGSMFNVAGAAVVDTAEDTTLAGNFVRHLLSAEAQEYFATRTKEYPLIPEVEPVGSIPTIDELQPPSDLDLGQLSNLKPTLDLMRDVGLTV